MRILLILTYLLFGFTAAAQIYEVEEVKLVATVQTINGINQKSDDFSATILNNKIYFTSSREYNQHSLGENNWDKNGYLNVFCGTIGAENAGIINVKDIKLLSNKLNFGSHTGPISFSPSGDTLYFTRVVEISEGKERVYRPQLFMTVLKKGSWTHIKRLSFSNNENSYAHPCYDALKKRLYFTSDRTGGKGGKDIYYSEMRDGKWSDPVNVESINTEDDETFPFVIGGNIFFSSNRAGGQGQMDIYFSAPEPADYPIKLEGLNSPYDDFGISIFPDLSAGFFSSNQRGDDDIYYFTLEKKITVKNQIAGGFTFRTMSGSPSDLSVQLYNEEGEFIYEERTDSQGHFLFEDVVLDSNYTVKLDGFYDDEMTLDFYNEKGETQASFILSKEGAFKYKKFFYENGGIIHMIPDDMKDFELSKATLSGKLVLEDSVHIPLKNSTVNLVKKDQTIAFTTKTDKSGNFEFNNLDLGEEYYIQIPECRDELILYVYGATDYIYTQLKCNSHDEFMYRRLRGDIRNSLSLIVEDTEENFMLNSSEISGRLTTIDSETPIKCTVRAYNDEGLLLGTTETDEDGNFQFNSLSAKKTYKFTADSNKSLQLTLYNRYGKQIAKIQEEENNYFVFRPLGFQSDYNLSLMDDKVQFDLNKSEQYDAVNVYFGSNKTEVNGEDLDKLNTILKLLKRYPQLKLSISAYADATASEEYNFALSQKRGEWIATYLTAKGIENNRFTINAYGETKIIDPENDAKNRRAELRVYQ